MATTSSTRLDDMAMDTDDDFQSNGLLGMTQTIPEQTSEPVEDKHAGTAFEETGPPDEGNEDTPLQAHTESDQPPQEPETPSRLNVPAPFTPPALSDDPFTSNGLLTGALDLAPTETSAALHSPEQSHDLGIGSSTRPPTSDLAPRRLEIHAHTVSLPRLPPIEGRTASGKVIRFPRRRRAAGTTQRAAARQDSLSASLNLLDVPVYKLLQELEEDDNLLAATKIQQEYDAENQPLTGNPATESRSKRQMWVDKYRPQKFTDLLGEERCQREVLGWLKEWDRCVFKRIQPGKKKRVRDEEENAYRDQLGRPREKILLMSGPPGLGKTTLAHVVATQAGYKVLEVNASDERSAGTVTGRIQNAIDAGSGLASNGKPTCVIIDEIDGVGGGGDQSFVRSLLKLIQDTPAKKNGKQPAKLLRRPIICICNDLYATALRPLRPLARIIRFKKAQSTIMVKRLRDICEKEALAADARSLTTLVEITNADVRSCLNTLQFIKSKSGEVNEKMIRSSTVGLKDSGTSLNAMWNSLFVPLSAKKRRQTQGIAEGKYVNRLAFDIQACGEYDKVVQGCFEHYPNLKPLDGSLQNVCRVHDWLYFYDRLNHRVSSEQEFELLGYMPYAVVPWHHHMASPANSQIPVEYPKADYECYLTSTTNKEVATSLAQSVPPSVRGLYTATTVLTELAPLLMRIISPNLKPINANLVKADEKAILSRLVELMISLNLRFHRDKTEEGQPMFRLEPPIDVFIHYEGKRATDIAVARFAVRQLVAQAIEAELVRRRGSDTNGGSTKRVHGMFKQGRNSDDDVQVDKIDIADRPPVDFFGRLIQVKGDTAHGSDNVGMDTDGPPAKKFRVVYKFNEGSSSAVRKGVKLGSLM